MKRIITCLLFIYSFSTLAQFVNIPDAKLRAKLIALYPACFNASSQMDTTCTAIVTATKLDVASLQISNLDGVQYFDKLWDLYCQTNYLTSLPRLPKTLAYLYCYNNQISSLPPLPSGLVSLECYNNLISSLPSLSDNMGILSCSRNKINTLPQLPASLNYLFCYENNLTSLPTLPATLWELNCNNNNLTVLPSLPATLSTLSCSSNKLTSLPALPSALTKLDASYNCFDPVPTNPRPSTLTNFKVSPNSSACLTAVDESKVTTTEALYPNPFTEELSLGTAGDLHLYQHDGKEIFHSNVVQGERLNLSRLKAGLYYYSIGGKTGKLLKE